MKFSYAARYKKIRYGYYWIYDSDYNENKNSLYEWFKDDILYHWKSEVYQLDIKNHIIHKYSSCIEAAKVNNLRASKIYDCCVNERETHGGYKWQYVHDIDDVFIEEGAEE